MGEGTKRTQGTQGTTAAGSELDKGLAHDDIVEFLGVFGFEIVKYVLGEPVDLEWNAGYFYNSESAAERM